MSGADRHYHDLDHLALLWERHERYGAAAGLRNAEADRLIACAIAYHDAFYHPQRPDNEERSARLWLEASRNSHIADDDRAWVADTIRATSDHLAYAPTLAEAGRDLPGQDLPMQDLPMRERARIWMLDLDLTPLGEDPSVFDANTERLRAENPDVSPSDFEAALLTFLRRLDDARAIYRSPVLSAAFQDMARRNVRRRIAEIEQGWLVPACSVPKV